MPLGRSSTRCGQYGYNSPFEKFDLAIEMAQKRIPVVYPRAIYVTGESSEPGEPTADARRLWELCDILAPDGRPALREGSDYVTLWGYWRGAEDQDAPDNTIDWSPVGASQACLAGLLTRDELREVADRHRAMLAAAGYEDLNPDFDHILLSFIPGGAIKRNPTGQIETRHCNFEFVRRIENWQSGGA